MKLKDFFAEYGYLKLDDEILVMNYNETYGDDEEVIVTNIRYCDIEVVREGSRIIIRPGTLIEEL